MDDHERHELVARHHAASARGDMDGVKTLIWERSATANQPQSSTG